MSEVQEYIYQDRVVAFIDVLGFHQKLYEFEEDAKRKSSNEGAEYLVSEKVNEFINTLKEITSRLDQDNLQYYLFSDNICITVDFIENPDLLISVLLTINELFHSFVQKGYFLRGGIDVGKFVDEKQIALGVPLAKAYLMETKDAVYPRVLISENYFQLINNYLKEEKFQLFVNLDIHKLIFNSCEFHYLNVFYSIFQKEDKVKFFLDFKVKIEENINLNSNNEKIQVKYKWLAAEFNSFIDQYSTILIFSENDLEVTGELLQELKTLKI